jgi:hypothetical protein
VSHTRPTPMLLARSTMLVDEGRASAVGGDCASPVSGLGPCQGGVRLRRAA